MSEAIGPWEAYTLTETWVNLNILREVRFKASVAGGKGGQHVNKVSTRIELYWKPADSLLLEEEVKQRLLQKLSSKLSREGELRIVCDAERSQLKNKQEAIKKYYKLLTTAFRQVKKRRPTKPTKASVKKRLESKAKKQESKKMRKRISPIE